MNATLAQKKKKKVTFNPIVSKIIMIIITKIRMVDDNHDNSGAPNGVFLLHALKALFWLFRVFLDL